MASSSLVAMVKTGHRQSCMVLTRTITSSNRNHVVDAEIVMNSNSAPLLQATNNLPASSSSSSVLPEIVKSDESSSEKGDFLDEKWASVQPSVFRQGLHFEGSKQGSGLVSFGQSSGTSASLFHPPPPSAHEEESANPKSLRELRRRIDQQQLPLHRRQFLQHQHGSGTLRQREITSRAVNASKANKAAADYQKTEEELWNEFKRPKDLNEIINLVDERIRTSRANGAFDNLPGRGKPLNLDRPDHVDSTEYLVNRMIIKSGGTVAWVEKDRDIRESLSSFRAHLRESWIQNGTVLDHKWKATLKAHGENMDKLNKLIRGYNLSAPSMTLQRCLYSLDREVEKLMGEIPPGSKPFAPIEEPPKEPPSPKGWLHLLAERLFSTVQSSLSPSSTLPLNNK